MRFLDFILFSTHIFILGCCIPSNVAKNYNYMENYKSVYFIMGNYGQGWEEVDQFGTRKEAVLMLKEYNLISGAHKIVCKRVKS